ncbi:hypothetical protein F2P79_017292 [Pimephales promelas]|nr:hypothetical protein F2P79_017292 [Pimephales promelas]
MTALQWCGEAEVKPARPGTPGPAGRCRESSITAATRTSADRACSSMIPDQVLGKLFPRAFLIGERLENKRRAAWMSH